MAYGSLFYDGNNYKHLAWPYCISFNLLNKKFTFYLPRLFLIYSIACNVQKLTCLEYEIHNKLQPRILKKSKSNLLIMMNLFNAMNAEPNLTDINNMLVIKIM